MKRRILLQFAAFAFLSVLCLGGAFFLLMHPIDIAPLPAGAGVPYAGLEKPPALNIAGPDRASLLTIVARPLFVRSRRPFQTPPPAPPRTASPQVPPPDKPQPPVTVDLLLKGVAFQPNVERALIGSSTHPEGIWLQKGADIDGWTIDRISEDSVILLQGEQAMELRLYPKSAADFGLK